MKDVHLHFTGTLAPDYVYDRLKSTKASFLDGLGVKCAHDLSPALRGAFTDNYKFNQQIFNDIYSVIQSVTKPINSKDVYDVYKVASCQLATHLSIIGISDYTIIAGPDTNIDNTYARYLGMIHGFEQSEKSNGGAGKICITFIRNNNGVMKNYSKTILEDICVLLQQEPFKSRCVGFDISGYEYPAESLLNSNLNVLDEILGAKKKYDLDVSVGLHAGEIITGTPADGFYDDYFIRLARRRLDNIGHGTYLWADKKNQKILKLFSGTTRFDVCPTSNSLLTPITDISVCLENLKECGVEYTLNRDDPLIFNNWQSRQR